MKRGDAIDVLVTPDWIGAPRRHLVGRGTVAYVERCPRAGWAEHEAEAVPIPGPEPALLTTWALYQEARSWEGGVESLDFCFGPARVWIVPR